MMYGNKLAVAVKHQGKVLREFGDSVKIPYGQEYSLLIKNLNVVRALVTVTIDGQPVTAAGLVVGPNTSVDLERWINDSLARGNKFKFIAVTDEIEQHRGRGVEDGLIRVEWQFEIPAQTGSWWSNQPGHWKTNADSTWGQSPLRGIHPLGVGYCNAITSSLSATAQDSGGITVPGSLSEQKFQLVSNFPVETQRHVMVIKLLGTDQDDQPVTRPITVKMKPKCMTCNRTNQSQAKFCSKCGTALEIYS